MRLVQGSPDRQKAERAPREDRGRANTTGVWKHRTAAGVPPQGAGLLF